MQARYFHGELFPAGVAVEVDVGEFGEDVVVVGDFEGECFTHVAARDVNVELHHGVVGVHEVEFGRRHAGFYPGGG